MSLKILKGGNMKDSISEYTIVKDYKPNKFMIVDIGLKEQSDKVKTIFAFDYYCDICIQMFKDGFKLKGVNIRRILINNGKMTPKSAIYKIESINGIKFRGIEKHSFKELQVMFYYLEKIIFEEEY